MKQEPDATGSGWNTATATASVFSKTVIESFRSTEVVGQFLVYRSQKVTVLDDLGRDVGLIRIAQCLDLAKNLPHRLSHRGILQRGHTHDQRECRGIRHSQGPRGWQQ